MKVSMTKDGVLIVRAENDLERYALDQWHKGHGSRRGKDIRVDTSASPTIGPLSPANEIIRFGTMIGSTT